MTHRSGFPELTSVLFASGAWSCGSRALQKADLHFPRVKGDGELARLEEFSGILHLLSPSKRAWWSGGSWTTSGWVCWAQWRSYCAQQTVPWPGGVKLISHPLPLGFPSYPHHTTVMLGCPYKKSGKKNDYKKKKKPKSPCYLNRRFTTYYLEIHLTCHTSSPMSYTVSVFYLHHQILKGGS